MSINDTDDITSPLWKISNGQNGDKYLTFSGSTSTSSNNQKKNLFRKKAFDDENIPNTYPTIRVYKIRWYILAVICMSNLANAVNWIIYSPIADFTAQFYSVSYDSVNYLSVAYLIISVPAGILSFWLIDNFGTRTSINLGAWFNFIGSLVKVLSSIDSANGEPIIDKSSKYTFLMMGQCLCALAQPFIMFVTTKFANNWFSDDQRALANTIALGSNTLGILIGAFISPQIVDNSYKYLSEMCLLNLITSGLSLIPAVMACFIRKSNPDCPPSYSAIINNNKNSLNNNLIFSEDDLENEQAQTNRNTFLINFKNYFSQVYKLLKSKDFIILFISFGLSLGLFNALTTLIEQILCVRGYTDQDTGYFGGAMIISGIIGSIICGIVLDKTKRFEEIAKICFCLSALTNIFFIIIQLYNNDSLFVYYLILISFCLTGLFGLPLLPVCMEMAVECVYPIPEATSTGLLFIAGQLFGVVMILFYPKMAANVDPNSYEFNSIQTCIEPNMLNITTTKTSMISSLTVRDFSYPLYGQAFLQVLISILFTCFFKCSYLRLRSEREKLAEKILNSARA